MSMLPVPGASKNNWGTILNDFLEVSHNDDGTLKSSVTEGITEGLATEQALQDVAGEVTALDVRTGSVLNNDGTFVDSEVMDAVVREGAPTGPEWSAAQGAIALVAPPSAGTIGQVARTGPDGPDWAERIISADWFSDLNVAIAAAGAGGHVHLSPGVTYPMPDPLLVLPGLSITGDHSNTSRINCTGEAALRVSAPLTVHNWVNLTGFRLDGGGVVPIGIDARGLTRSIIDRMVISNFTDKGVIFGGDTGTYAAGWSNTIRQTEIQSSEIGIQLLGMSGGSPTANNIRMLEVIINMADTDTAIGIDAVQGSTNYLAFCDIGYNGDKSGIGLNLQAAADFWTVIGNRFEDVAHNTGVNHPVEIRNGSQYHLFLGNTYHTSSLAPWVNDANADGYNTILDNRSRNAEFTAAFHEDGVPMVRTKPTYVRHPSSSSAAMFEGKVINESFLRYRKLINGQDSWFDPTTGVEINRMQVTSTSTGRLSWMDGGLVAMPRVVSSLPAASASRRGCVFRVEGGTGVADRLWICEKNSSDAYAWRQI